MFIRPLPAEHTGRQHLLGLQGTFGAGHAKPECQSGGFPGPFVWCQVCLFCSAHGEVSLGSKPPSFWTSSKLKQRKEGENLIRNQHSLMVILSKRNISFSVQTILWPPFHHYELYNGVLLIFSKDSVQEAEKEQMWSIANFLYKTSVSHLRSTFSLLPGSFQNKISEMFNENRQHSFQKPFSP